MASNEFFRSVLDEAEKCDTLAIAALGHPDCPVWVAEEIITKHQDWDAYDCAIGFKGVSYDILLREAGTNQSANEACSNIDAPEMLEKVIRGDAKINNKVIENIVCNNSYKLISAEAANMLAAMATENTRECLVLSVLVGIVSHSGLTNESLEKIAEHANIFHGARGLDSVMYEIIGAQDLSINGRGLAVFQILERFPRNLDHLYRSLARKLVQAK